MSAKMLPVATDENGMTDTFQCPVCLMFYERRLPSRTADINYCPYCGVDVDDEGGEPE